MSADDNFHIEIGNYRVVREIDSGAFGRVYLAQHTLLKNRTVAIKLLHNTRLSSSEERESFLREAQFLEVLKHPYILPILDVGIHEGFPYLVAEYALNGSLRDRIKRYAPHPLPMQETLAILTQIGQALYYAHQQHIIHRDIKPENILFNAKGEALLADFGVATMIETASIKFATVIGTPSYMAPEQFQNSISKESDQYTLGCVAYELFTGQRPFTAHDFFAIGFKHMREAPIPPSQLNPQLPPYVEQAILRAMAKQRTDRFPDIKAFITELHLPTNSQGHLPAMPSAPYPAVPVSQIPAANSTTHLSQVPTFSQPNPATASQKLPAVGLPQTVHRDQNLISTGPREQLSNLLQGPITPLPPSSLPIPANFDSDPGKLTRPMYAPSLMPADSGLLPTPQYAGPVTPFPIEQTYLTPTSRNLAQDRQNKPRRRWLIMMAAVIAVLMLILSGVFGSLLIFFHPTLSISGSSKVVPGSTLHLHGSGFVPGIGVSLTLDDGMALAYMGNDTTGEAWYSGSTEPAALQTSFYNQAVVQDPLNGPLAANSTGGFDMMIWVNDMWAVGIHTIHASAGIWSTQIDFTIVPKMAQLTINTKVLDFGKVGMDVQPTLSIAIRNAGGARLIWSAEVNNATWLRLQKNTGIIEPQTLQQTINVTADTRALKESSYTDTLQISSNGGDAQVQVKLQVGPHHNGPVLDVNPASLDFGTILTNRQSMQVISIGNVGNETLNWTADAGGTGWLHLTNSMGTVTSGALPQSIYAVADSSNLTPGNYSGIITIHSNGGTTRMSVSLAVSGPTPPPGVTPTPTRDPTAPPRPSPRPSPTPTLPPSPTPSPTPDPTPRTSETIYVPYVDGISGVTTSNSYYGTVTVQISGTGQAIDVHGWTDAFYVYTNGQQTPVQPWHKSVLPSWVLTIDSGPCDPYIIGGISAYHSSHAYAFTMNAPGGQISFGVGDTQPQDNTGGYTITITQN